MLAARRALTQKGPYAGWRARKAITADHTKAGGTVAPFVASFDLSADADIAAGANADLSDLRFTDVNLNPLPFEVESSGGFENYTDGSWVWYNGPRCISFHGTHNRIYIGSVTSTGTVAVHQYDCDTNVTSTFALHSGLVANPPDDHINPGLLALPGGKIMAFYSNADVADGKMRTRVTSAVEDISAWTTEVATQVVTSAHIFEYPHPHYLSSEGTGLGRIYVFFNDRGGSGGISYITSDDLGTTWSSVTNVYNPVLPNISYAMITDNGVDRIDIAFNDNPPLAPGSAGQTVITSNQQFHVFIKAGNVCRSDGTVISSLASLSTGLTTAGLTSAGAEVTPFNGTNGPFWIWDIAYDASGHPQIVYATYPNSDWTGVKYNYAVWNGSTWVTSVITPAGNWISPNPTPGGTYSWAYSGGISLMPGTSATVYLSKQVNKQGSYDAFHIEKWTTANQGTTWSRVVRVTPGSRRKNIRPIIPTNRTTLTSASVPEVVYLSGAFTQYQSESMSIMTYPPYSGATVKKAARVQIPSIDTASDKTVLMYYGNPSASDGSSPTVFDTTYQAAIPFIPRSSVTNIYEHAPALNMTGWTSFTLSMWAQLMSAGNDGVADWLYSNLDAGTRVTPSIRLTVTSGIPGADFLVYNASANTLVGGGFTDKTGLHDNNWHHYALTWDGTTLKLYVDGVVSSTTYTSPQNHMAGTGNGSQGGMIGWSPNVSTRKMYGNWSDFYINNTVQPLAWIQTQAHARTGGSGGSTTVGSAVARQW